jgi:hypothetical protein
MHIEAKIFKKLLVNKMHQFINSKSIYVRDVRLFSILNLSVQFSLLTGKNRKYSKCKFKPQYQKKRHKINR